MWQGWMNGILGAWLFLTAFFNFSGTVDMWTYIIIGVLTAVFGLAMAEDKPWQGWLTGITGFWLIVSAFIPSLLTHAGYEWNAIISGILLMAGGFGAINKTPKNYNLNPHLH